MTSNFRRRSATKRSERPSAKNNFATCYAVDDKAYRAFTDALDRPLPATEELRKLMEAKAPWRK